MKNKSTKTSKIIREIKAYARSIIDEKQDKDIKDAFSVLDQDASGEIDSEELKEILKKVSTDITDEQIEDLMKIADKDGSGSIDQGEFLHAMKNTSSKVSAIIRQIKQYAKGIIDKKHDNDLRAAFAVFDEDNSGEIDAEELRAIMSNISTDITQEQIDELMKVADKDDSGFIDQAEFLMAMKSRSSKTSLIIRQIKAYAKSIIDQKQDKDIKDAFSVLD